MARPTLTTHRKFRRLTASLGSAIVARGVLELMWDACYESGDEYVGTAADIENLVGWAGDSGVLAKALLEAGAPEGHGFIEPVGEGASTYRVHDLWHHAPEYVAKRRQRELKRQEKEAPERRTVGDRRTAPNGADFQQSLICQIESDGTPAPALAPAPAPAQKNVSAELSSTPVQPPFLVFPVVGPRAGDWPLTEAQVARWAALYPGLDVRAESRKALAWIEASPRRRKTYAGMSAFLVGWYGRANDSGRGARAPEPTRRPDSAPLSCPHTPQCPAPGRWACQQLTASEAYKRSQRAS